MNKALNGEELRMGIFFETEYHCHYIIHVYQPEAWLLQILTQWQLIMQ